MTPSWDSHTFRRPERGHPDLGSPISGGCVGLIPGVKLLLTEIPSLASVFSRSLSWERQWLVCASVTRQGFPSRQGNFLFHFLGSDPEAVLCFLFPVVNTSEQFPNLLYLFPTVIVTNYHKLSGLGNNLIILEFFWGSEVCLG